jgi:hypothetical protein
MPNYQKTWYLDLYFIGHEAFLFLKIVTDFLQSNVGHIRTRAEALLESS